LPLANSAADLHQPSLARPSLTFLYHELRPEQTAYTYALQCQEFAQHLDRFAAARLSAHALRPEITFDDGHMSDYEYALPILAAHNVAAHFFITAGWTGQKPGYMGWTEIRALHQAGQRIGAHGWTHTLLTHCTPSELHTELVSAREALEDRLGCAITSMSLPGGRYNRRVLSACRAAGYSEVYTSTPQAESPAAEVRAEVRAETRAETRAEVPETGPAPPLRLIGRLNLRSGVPLDTLEELLKPGSAALARLKRSYQLKAAAKSLLGDTLYASLWARLNRQKAGASAAVMTHP